MSKYVNDYYKQAIWEAFNKKCFYCRELLQFKNIHIDHVIPQNAFTGNEAHICKKYNLEDSFNFNSLDNFVSSCQSCNSGRKGAKELENAVPLWLEEIKCKKQNITERASKLKIELSLDLPDQHKEFFLSSPDFMLSNLSIDQIRIKDIPLYKELTFSDRYYPLSLTDPKNDTKKVSIKNLSMYEHYVKKGYYPYTTPEIGVGSICDACLTFFKIFEEAMPSKININFKEFFRLLPIDLLHPMLLCYNDNSLKRFRTIGEYLDSDEKISYEITDNSVKITIKYNSDNVYPETELLIIDQILQANFTNNSDAEILFFVYFRSAGTLHFSTPILVGLQRGEWKTQPLPKIY